MLRLAGEPFSFRYVSFQKGVHKTLEFLALSRWGQVPVLVDGERVYLQSAAISSIWPRHSAGSRGLIPRRAKLCGSGCTGALMFCFHRSSTAMLFNSVSENSYQ